MALDICSQIVDSSSPSVRQTGNDGNYDILNFAMFAASGAVFENTECNQQAYYVEFTYAFCLFAANSRCNVS